MVDALTGYSHRSAKQITLAPSVIIMVLAATAIPVELRPLGSANVALTTWIWSDVVENVVGYVPVGIVLGRLGWVGAIFAVTLISTSAELSQLVMMHRDPSVIDIAANVIGGTVGAGISMRWRIRSPGLTIDQGNALVAAAMAALLAFGVWTWSYSSYVAVNSRGVTEPGTLEAYWKLDERRDRIAEDSSGHGLHARFHKEPKRVAGMIGGAARFDGASDYIDAGKSTPLRLRGSMTISAWVKPSSFPADDAVC